MGSPNKSYVGTKFCGLCRGIFPLGFPEGLNAWQFEFRAVLCLDSTDDGTIEMTDIARLPTFRGSVHVSLSGHPQPSETITICLSQLDNVEKPTIGPAFCFHDWCYSILLWKLSRFSKSIVKSVLYKLVQSLLPCSSEWKNAREAYQLDPTSALHTLVAHADQYPQNLQPEFVPRLPPEVRARIWEFVGLGSPCSAFIIVTVETSRLVPHIKYRPTHDLELEAGCHLSIQTINVIGTEYIQDLVITRGHRESSNILGVVTGLKYALGLSGICAINVVGIDWESGWLGKVPHRGYVWYGMIPSPCLRFHYNRLNCVNISDSRLCAKSVHLWDRPQIPASITDLGKEVFDPERDTVGSSHSSRRRFFRYLPLFKGDEYITGLTIYHEYYGIVGLEAHFARTSELSGHRNGCALYFALYPDEKIAYAWIRIVNKPGFTVFGMALSIQTTLGRLHTFGSYILPALVTDNQYKWILLKSRGFITGVYCEIIRWRIMELGVTDDGCSSRACLQIPQYHAHVFPPFSGLDGTTLLSVATLRAVKEAHLCRVSNRCIGILIHYLNGQSAVLGQWRSQGIAQHSCICDSDTTCIANIYFTMSRVEDYKFVTNISFSEDMSTVAPDSEYHIFELGLIAWWFSYRQDTIMPWKGEFHDIPKESIASQEQFIS